MPEVQERLSDLESLVAELARSQIKTEAVVRALSREMADFRDDMKEDRKRMNKAWGDLANKLGTIIEDIVAPNIKRLAAERFDGEPLEAFTVLAERRGPDGVMREFDVMAVGAGKVVLAESKSTITAESVPAFAEKRRTFFDHFPEWRGRELIAVLASWHVPEAARLALTAARIYGLEMGDETMRLVNDGEF